MQKQVGSFQRELLFAHQVLSASFHVALSSMAWVPIHHQPQWAMALGTQSFQTGFLHALTSSRHSFGALMESQWPILLPDLRASPVEQLFSFSAPDIQRLYVFCFPWSAAVTNPGLWTTWQAGGPLPRCSSSSFCGLESGPPLAVVKVAHCTTSRQGILGQRTNAHKLHKETDGLPEWLCQFSDPWAMHCLYTALPTLESSVLGVNVAIQMGRK